LKKWPVCGLIYEDFVNPIRSRMENLMGEMVRGGRGVIFKEKTPS
jgi:hypothetical protein